MSASQMFSLSIISVMMVNVTEGCVRKWPHTFSVAASVFTLFCCCCWQFLFSYYFASLFIRIEDNEQYHIFLTKDTKRFIDKQKAVVKMLNLPEIERNWNWNDGKKWKKRKSVKFHLRFRCLPAHIHDEKKMWKNFLISKLWSSEDKRKNQEEEENINFLLFLPHKK